MSIKKEVYKYDKPFSSKETLKGNAVEDDAIEFINELFFKSYKKSESELSDKYGSGHPDIEDEKEKMIIDNKSSWSKATFPVFSEDAYDSGYEWQVRRYLMLKGGVKKGWTKGKVVFTLMDTPDELIPEWEPISLHDMSDLDDKLRITWFDVELTQEIEDLMVEVGELALKYAEEYKLKIKNKCK